MREENFIKIADVVNYDRPLINVNLISYINESARSIRLSDGLMIHTNAESMNELLIRIGRTV